MKHNFDKLTDRHSTACVKWDGCTDKDVIPMWIADMDFEVAPAITEALRRRVDHGIFGYNIVPDSYYEAIIRWMEHRHNFHIEREWIQTVPSVVAAASCVIKALTSPGDSVLLMAPAYNCFFPAIRNNKCNAELSPLRVVNGRFVIDFDDFERRAARQEVKIYLQCNPHNPSGRVWTPDELARLSDICRRHNVIVVSDEIHCEIVMPDHRYTPFALVSGTPGENITLHSPTKGFNIAGLQIANIICDNPEWRQKIDRAINDNELCDLNPFGILALQAAYNESEDWLDEMCLYVYENYLQLRDFITEEMPRVKVNHLEGTYLVWVDVSALPLTAEELSERLVNEGKVWMNPGKMYADPDNEQHLRINIACPRERMMEALRRMARVVNNL